MESGDILRMRAHQRALLGSKTDSVLKMMVYFPRLAVEHTLKRPFGSLDHSADLHQVLLPRIKVLWPAKAGASMERRQGREARLGNSHTEEDMPDLVHRHTHLRLD